MKEEEGESKGGRKEGGGERKRRGEGERKGAKGKEGRRNRGMEEVNASGSLPTKYIQLL